MRLAQPKIALGQPEGLGVIDEVQRRPDLFPVLRVLADQPRRGRRFLILGSASPELLRQGSETLAGRIAFVEMAGFDLGEVGQRRSADCGGAVAFRARFSPEARRRAPSGGASWEGFVLEELIGLAGERNAFYWRTQAGAELDLLLFMRGKRIGVEVKYADPPAMTRSMQACIESLKLDRLYVVYPGLETYSPRPGVEVMPLASARERIDALSGQRAHADEVVP